MRSRIGFILRQRLFVIALSLTLGAVGLHYSLQLYRNLRPNLEELLPTYARSVQDLDEISHRLSSIDSLSILVFSNHPVQSKRFVDDLAARIQALPKSIVASVEYRITDEIRFFKNRSILYVDLADLKALQRYVRDRIEYERDIRNPLNIFSETDIPEPKFNFETLRHKYDSKVSTFTRFPDGYYATADEHKRAVLVYVPGKSSDIVLAKTVKAKIESIILELKPQSYAPDLEIHYTGGVENVLEEHEALIADLELSTTIVVLLVSAAMFLYFRSVRATIVAVLSVTLGAAIAFGISYFIIGYLNANSAFLASIVIGNGLNFGIILIARYIEERRHGRLPLTCAEISMRKTATPTLTAALAAGLAYGSLILTDFRGFRQFGIIGLIGMLTCWIMAYTFLPAALLTLDRRRPIISLNQRPKKLFSHLLAEFVTRRSRWIWAASILATFAAIATWPRFGSELLEADLTKLRSKASMERGSGYYSHFQDEIFDRYLSPIAILPPSRADAERIAARLKTVQEKEGKNSLISTVQTIQDFIPKEQNQKQRVLRDTREMLPKRLLKQLSPADQKRARDYLKPVKPVTLKQLPKLVREKFTERDGTLGNLVLVEPPLGSKTLEQVKLLQFVHTLRENADAVSLGTPVAGSLPISADTLESISRDGPRATLFAFLAVVLLVILLFRSLKIITSELFALMIGVTWLSGLILAFDLKINFLNFVALPITFGIGVDYGVNIFQRYHQDGIGSISQVLIGTGGAVALSSLTTIIGYSSLLMAQNQAFVSFGLLAVLGEITCVTAALVSLPAYLSERDRRRLARESKIEEQPLKKAA